MINQKWIPNILTLMRMILTFMYLILLHDLYLNINNKLYFALAIITFLLICITDLTDGKIARKVKAVSVLGGFLDVTADLFFIVSSLAMLIIYNVIPAWVIVMVFAKFVEFLVTSYIIRKYRSISNKLFVFDSFGRIAAANFFLIPAIASFVYLGLNIIYLNIFIYVTLAFVIVSSLGRCINCYRILFFRLPQFDCDDETLKSSF